MVHIVTCSEECAECGSSNHVVGVFDSREAAHNAEVEHIRLHKNSGHNFPTIYTTAVKMNEANHDWCKLFSHLLTVLDCN